MPPDNNRLFLYDLTLDDPIFRLVVIITLVLLALVVLFGVVAVALRVNHNRARDRYERLEKFWLPKILAVLNGELAPDQVRGMVAFEDRILFLDVLYRFARQLRGQELAVIRGIAHPFLPNIAAMAKTGDTESRARRIQIIGLLGFEEYSDQVVEALDDPSPLVAMVAARILMRRDHPEYAGAVLKKLHRFQNWSHELLASLLYGLGPGVADELRGLLADAEQPVWLRRVVADALGRMNDVASADIAVSVMENTSDESLRMAALTLLGRTGRQEHLPILRTWANAEDNGVRAYAVRALSRLGGSEEDARLVAALEDPSPWVALYAAEGLRSGVSMDILRDLAASEHPRAELAQQVLVQHRTAA
jgi:HEAT repeat protein